MNKPYKEDLRITRTKKLLRKALFSLLQQKSIDKINVIDICEKAMVHRATFYKHFEDKYHLLSCSIEEIKEEVLIASTENVKFESLEQMYLYLVNRLLDYAVENKQIALDILENNKNDTLIQIIYGAMERCVEYFFTQNEGFVDYKIPIPIVSRFYAGGVTAVVLWWIQSNGHIDKTQLLEYSRLIITEGVVISPSR